MKKVFIIAAVAAVVACSNNEEISIVEKGQVEIGFSNAFIGKQTKSNLGEMTTATLATNGSTMEVWGWKTYNSTPTVVFNAKQVTYNSSSTQSTTKWEYSPLKYWDFAASYDFYAVAPYSTKYELNASTKKITATGIEPVQILADNNGTAKVTSATTTAIDYLVASTVHRDAPKGNASDGDVAFTFYHILSKLAVNVKTTDNFNNSGSNYPQIKLKNLSINLQGMCPSYTQKTAGAVTAHATTGDTWSGTASSATDYVCFNADGSTVTDLLLTNSAQEIASYLVAPTATGDTPATYTYTVDVTYDIYYSATEGDKETFVANDKAISTLTSFTQNTNNTLTVTIDPQAIYFDVESVQDWTNGLDGTVTIK